MTESPRPPAGWYPDPYRPDSLRWFDGSVWTSQAVDTADGRPDRPLQSNPEGSSARDLRTVDRSARADLAVPCEGERPYDGGGGWQGVEANRIGRWTMRTGQQLGPAHASRWLGALAILLALLAWGDPQHRAVLAVVAVPLLVATVVVGIREARQRAYWRKVGDRG